MGRLMALVANRRVDLSRLLTHHFGLEDIEAAFDLFSNQRDGVLKVALHPSAPKAGGRLQPAGVGACDEQC